MVRHAVRGRRNWTKKADYAVHQRDVGHGKAAESLGLVCPYKTVSHTDFWTSSFVSTWKFLL